MRKLLAVSVVLMMCCVVAAGKDKKKKILLPTDVLQARTVVVVIDPDAGVPVETPNANRTAQGRKRSRIGGDSSWSTMCGALTW